MVRGLGLLHSVADIEKIVVTTSKDGTPVLVRSVADVSIGEKVRLGQVGINDDPDAVEGIVLMRRGENPSFAVDQLKEAWGRYSGWAAGRNAPEAAVRPH